MWNLLVEHLPLAIILIIATIVCGADLFKAIGVWKQKRQEHKDAIIKEHEEKEKQNNQVIEFQATLTSILNKLEEQDKKFDNLDKRITDLTSSDMHDIKSWIVEKYHEFYNEKGWIDAFTADTLDHRYEDYKKEGGNSYIDTLVSQMHTLPMDPNLSITNQNKKRD